MIFEYNCRNSMSYFKMATILTLLVCSCRSQSETEKQFEVSSVEEFLEAIVQIECSFDQSVSYPSGEIFYESREQCADYWISHSSFEQELQRLQSAIVSGDMKFDKKAAQEALEWHSFYAPTADITQSKLYRRVFSGNIALHDVCHISESCADEAFCYREDDANCTGVCTPTYNIGQECEGSLSCSIEQSEVVRCSAQSGCESLELPFATKGETCGKIEPNRSKPCEPELYCSLNSEGQTGTCVSYKRIGESCEMSDLCILGSVCFDNTCLELEVETVPGNPCLGGTYPSSATFCSQFRNLSCSNGICEQLGYGNAGSSCVPMGCNHGLFCGNDEQGSNICVQQEALGEVCSRNVECTSLYCDPSTSVCAEDICG